MPVPKLNSRDVLMHTVLLTIAIPTFNRATYLSINLAQLCPQLCGHENDVELLISNNDSQDETDDVVKRHIDQGSHITYIRNQTNIGSDRNIAQCFQCARGRYVLILGDDDLLLNGAVDKILNVLRSGDYGICYLAVYGYEENFNRERPPYGRCGHNVVFSRQERFIRKLGIYATFISANVINKELLHDLDVEQFVGTNLVQTYLVYAAILRSTQNMYVSEYLVACKRNNSGGYNFLDVFVGSLNQVFETYTAYGLPKRTFDSVRNDILTGYILYRISAARLAGGSEDIKNEVVSKLRPLYGANWRFWVCIDPTLRLPLAFAIVWAGAWIVVTRAMSGESGRMLSFVCRKIRMKSWRSVVVRGQKAGLK